MPYAVLNSRPISHSVFCIFILLGVMFRFYHITASDFIFYDEGYYLNYNNYREFADIIARQQHQFTWKENLLTVYADLRISLGSGKPLWLFLTNLRAFFTDAEGWFFPRILSAIAGCFTLLAVYRFAKRYFSDQRMASLSVIFLAVMPSHVFYSRLGLQEALSTLCFLIGLYFYLFPRPLGWRTFLSSVILMLAYFTNYRLIVLPVLIAFCEIYTSLSLKQRPSFRKYLWHTLIFLLLIFSIGSIDQGQHIKVIFPWMLHQADLAQRETFEWFNWFSYPYYTFRLESMLFGILFWGNIYNMIRRKWYDLFPFFLVCVQMLIFSFPEEKGARYICVVYPLMSMAVANLIVQWFDACKAKKKLVLLTGLVTITLVTLIIKSWKIMQFQSAYRPAVEYLNKKDANAKFVTSQMWVMNLYTEMRNVQDLPHVFPFLLKNYKEGAQYLVLDPQVYISWTKSGKRFDPNLEDYLEFVDDTQRPVKIFSHLDAVMLERFVFEHNENLKRSLSFLELAKKDEGKNFGAIRIYDVNRIVNAALTSIAKKNILLPPFPP